MLEENIQVPTELALFHAGVEDHTTSHWANPFSWWRRRSHSFSPSQPFFMLEEKITQLLIVTTLFHAGGEDHMLVNDHPLLPHSAMLTVTRITSVTHHSLLRGMSFEATPSLPLKYSNFTFDRGLVNTSAICSSVATYWSFTAPFHYISDIMILDLDVLEYSIAGGTTGHCCSSITWVHKLPLDLYCRHLSITLHHVFPTGAAQVSSVTLPCLWSWEIPQQVKILVSRLEDNSLCHWMMDHFVHDIMIKEATSGTTFTKMKPPAPSESGGCYFTLIGNCISS